MECQGRRIMRVTLLGAALLLVSVMKIRLLWIPRQ